MSDRDQLIEYLLGFAKLMLKDSGAFHPFGAKITSAGDLVAVGADSGEEHPPAQDLIDLLLGAFRSEAGLGEVRAIGLGLDTRVVPPGTNEKTDAVCLRLEDSKEAMELFYPYVLIEDGPPAFGEMFAQRMEPSVFGKGTG
jgi:hypothetical protein